MLVKKNKIIQLSHPGTGSTVLTNALYGMIHPSCAVQVANASMDDFPTSIDIIKTHIYAHKPLDTPEGPLGIDFWLSKFKKKYNLYFVCSERKSKKERGTLHLKYRAYKNVLIIPYKNLLETSAYRVTDIINYLHHEFKNFFPRVWPLDPQAAVVRIQEMNARYEHIKDRSFSYFDKFYHLHGSHRGRHSPRKNTDE